MGKMWSQMLQGDIVNVGKEGGRRQSFEYLKPELEGFYLKKIADIIFHLRKQT